MSSTQVQNPPQAMIDRAQLLAYSAHVWRMIPTLTPVEDFHETRLGSRFVVSRDPARDIFGLSVDVYADVNDHESIIVSLHEDSGKCLQTIKLTDVAEPVAVATIVTLINYAQKATTL
jgi:hypothetical protein